MSVNALNTALSGIQTNQFRVDTAANNIANVNTDGFRATTVQTADRAYINDIGTGTQVTGTYAPPTPGPMTVNPQAGAQQNQAYDPANPGPGGPAGAAQATQAMGAVQQQDLVELSNTDMVREMTNMQAASTAYSANVAVARTVNEMNQTLIDLNA